MKTRTMAVVAVLALAFAGVFFTISEDSEATDPVTTYAVTSFAEGKNAAGTEYNGMMVIGYADEVILIDTTMMTGLGDENVFMVTLTATPSANTYAADPIKIGPVSMTNGRIYIDGSMAGTEHLIASPYTSQARDVLNDATVTTVMLSSYATPNTALSTASLTWVDDPAKLQIYTNHNNVGGVWEKANGFILSVVSSSVVEEGAVENAALNTQRKYVYDLTEPSSAGPFHDGNKVYKLKGYALTPAADAEIIIEPSEAAIEDIIIAMGTKTRDASADPERSAYSPLPIIADKAAGVAMNPQQVTNQITLFAIWEKNVFTLELKDGEIANATAAAVDADFGINNVQIGKVTPAPATGLPTEIALASVTSVIEADSIALLKIQQSTRGQYYYDFPTVYKSVARNEDGTKIWTEATVDSDYKIKMVTNGIYKVYEVKADLRIGITYDEVTIDVPTDAYAFQIESMTNDGTAAEPTNGKVRLSLDLFDYVAYKDTDNPTTALRATDNIEIKGTYFRSLDDGQRVYGNLDYSGKLEKSTNVKSFIDNKAETSDASVISGKAAMNLNSDDSVYDLVWTGTDDYSIFAAKGVWTQNSVIDESGAKLKTDAVETPWALYTPATA